MVSKEGNLPPEQIEIIKALVESKVKVRFSDFFILYKEIMSSSDGVELTEEDLVAEILEAGGYQADIDAPLEDVVVIGASAIGENLGLFDLTITDSDFDP
jgi:hypothetical protein